MTRECFDCGGPVSRSATGRCRACSIVRLNTDPTIIEQRRVKLAEHLAKPETQARQRANHAHYIATMPEEHRERRREQGRRQTECLKAAAAKLPAETRAENGRKRSATMLAWCPPEWRDKYREIKSRGRSAAAARALVFELIAGRPEPAKYAQQHSRLEWRPADRRDQYRSLQRQVGAVEARRLMEEELARQAKRHRAQPQPMSFEQQLARVAAGARLVERPNLHRADPTFTLGGVASGAL